MHIYTTYKVKIKHFNHIFKDTVAIYRAAVEYLITVCIDEWHNILSLNSKQRVNYIEHLIHKTKDNSTPKYDFNTKFYKMPSYLRRSCISEAIGKVSSYKSNLTNWYDNPIGKMPSIPKAGFIYPSLYKDNMYSETNNSYQIQIKVYIRNTWDWITIDLRKSDIDYINRHCKYRKKCAPTLQKRGKEWYLDFPFEEKVTLCDADVKDQTIVAVDLGINTAATISVMRSDGTILGRHFYKPLKETDHLTHSINRIKKAQQHGNCKTPRLWAKAKGINHDIASKTANYIMDIAVLYNADVIVFEHLDRTGKVRGSKKQKLKMWRSQEVQSIVTNKAHRLGIRINHICAWGTSRLAFDGSGAVLRGKEGGFNTYELCKFQNGKTYNCDLSAAYNIGARYFIRELLKSLNVNLRLQIEAKVPQLCKRSTCTFSTLISLNAVFMSV